ncbi:PREDICTED: kinesin-like protein KIF20B [Gekko japonicus]|uniref:Kinesin-like protein KIF20B n=1 Tax=Gekko japonicus TaxID=146911 RepID=A0ABM1LCR0_GEKJA|nr:PREDICTED: kinesin-like protein KIF20B [Gekko japonicus]
MEADLNKPAVPRPSFVKSVEMTPRIGSLDATDIKRNLYEDFSSISDISQRESLESREHIYVCLRIRPLVQSENEIESQGCVSVLDSASIILKAPKSSMVFRLSEKNLGQMVQKFTFSQVFGPETTQEEFFEGTVKQPVQDFLRGHSRLVFTYGVTNAGKTYTYQGTEDDVGVLPRALEMLFRNIPGKLYPKMDFKPHRCREHRKLNEEEVREEMLLKNSLLRLMKEIDHQNGISGNHNGTADNSEEVEQPSREEESGAKFSVWVSFCEIYNESIYDLLLPMTNDKRRKMLRLAQDIKGCSYVKDLQWIQVSNAKEAFKLVKLGLKNQSFASTKLNANSSRSHSIFTVKMLKIDSTVTHVMRVSELFLCDLAGSERCTRTHNEGERLKESGNINASLLILGKCISALKTNQQSKMQLHIPFRESKLTHFFQGFFSGKGKVCMIVNVSPSAAAYDETLNVLKFSAIAQNVIVLDSSNSPQEQTCDQRSMREELETEAEEADALAPLKRATILWERTLEDVIEDEEELAADSSGEREVHSVENNILKGTAPEIVEDTLSQAADEDDGDDEVVIGKEEYLRLLNIIEDLKNKLINERKEKLFMELRIREEVTQECARYLADNEKNLKMLAAHKQELMEDHFEERMQIYKDFVKEYIPLANDGGGLVKQPVSDEQDRPQGDAARDLRSSADFVCMVESLQHNVSDIKQQAETVFGLLNAAEDPLKTIEKLEKQLADVTAELSKIREKLSERNEEMKMQENKLNESAQVLQEATEKMVLQNEQIQELTQIVEQKDCEISKLKDLIVHLETIVKDSENTIATIKQQMEQENQKKKANCAHFREMLEKHLDTGRKRCLEREEEEEGPPAKQGSINDSSKGTLETKQLRPCTFREEKEKVELEQKTKMLEAHLATLGEQLEKERSKSEGLTREIASLSQELSSSEEYASGLRKELHQQQANNEEIKSELVGLKSLNKKQEGKIQELLEKLEAASEMIAEKKSKVKAVEVKIGELIRLGSGGPTAEADLSNWNEWGELSKDGREEIHARLGRESSFHCSIESIWETSKRIINSSSQKSSQIADLQRQVEQLQKRTANAEEETSRLKSQLSEAVSQAKASLQEKERILGQLRDLKEENALCSEKYRAEEKKTVDYLEKIKNLNDLLEQHGAKEANVAALEQALQERETAVLVAEREVRDLQEKLAVLESKIKSLSNHELQLKEEVQELKNNLKAVDLLEKEREESKQAIVRLKEDLLESTALSSQLQVEIRQKEEEYTDLKEKLADAKKQIEQVCTMRTEEKLLRNRMSELEKSKKQLVEELEVKQRTIQQFKKEELNEKLEDILQQYQKVCEDLSSKEKIIEDMKLTLEEQEQTQSEQDQVLEARIADSERLVAELQVWKKRYRELGEQSSASRQQRANAECENTAKLPSEELERLQEKLKECEEKHQMDRKKWLTEKMILITQAKEAETHRNREMKRFAGDRELHAKQLLESENLVAEKENDLQKWRAERDQLVAALEVQLSSLISSNAQKDAEIEELKKAELRAPTQVLITTVQSYVNSKTKMLPMPVEAKQHKMEDLHGRKLKEKQIESVNCNRVGDTDSQLQNSSRASSVEDIQDQSEIILDSCEVSSENDVTSRFPKPEMEIHFTPLQPNKMEVKHQGSPSSVTIKVPKARKRKSSTMDESSILSSLRKCKLRNKGTSDGVGQEDVKNENEKNAETPANGSSSRQKKKTVPDPSLKKNYSLRRRHFAESVTSPGNKGGSLHKFGYFLQSSPTIIHSKAKKLMATIKSPKSTEEGSVKENDLKPKRAKRRLYNMGISSPMEFSGHVIVMDQKESDHEIIKRRLRTRKT